MGSAETGGAAHVLDFGFFVAVAEALAVGAAVAVALGPTCGAVLFWTGACTAGRGRVVTRSTGDGVGAVDGAAWVAVVVAALTSALFAGRPTGDAVTLTSTITKYATQMTAARQPP